MTQQGIVPFDYASLDAETRIVVQQRTGEIKSLMQRTMHDILDIGRKFTEVRDLLRHNKAGGFEGWLDAEGLQKRTAYNFIRVYAAFADQTTFANRAESAQLDIVISALFALAAPSTPESARFEALQKAIDGQKLTVKDTKAIIASHKPQPPQPVPAPPDPEPTPEPPASVDWAVVLQSQAFYLTHPHQRVVYQTAYFSHWEASRAGEKGMVPQRGAYIIKSDIFKPYRFEKLVRPNDSTPSLSAETPTPEGQALHAAGVDDSTSPDEPTTLRFDPREVSNAGEWTPSEKAYMNRAQAVVNHAHPGKMPFVGNPIDEVARLKARIAELESENARLVAENIRLRAEVVGLRVQAQPPDVVSKPAERML